jgi:hypothetical protein
LISFVDKTHEKLITVFTRSHMGLPRLTDGSSTAGNSNLQ